MPAKGKPGRYLVPALVLPELLPAVGSRWGEQIRSLNSVPLGEP